jgi:hypothetical protein
MTTPGLVTAYSNTASFLDVLGASHSAYTPETGTGYDSSFGGTSAATPYVAGAVALIQAAALAETGSYLPPETIRTILVNTGTPITDTKGGGLTPGITKPLVDVEAAYLSFASGNPIQDIDVPESSLSYFLPVAGTEVAGFNIANQADVGGLDLNFDIVTNGVGADVEDTIGGPNFVVSGSNVSFGNIFQVTQDTTLKEIQSGLSFTGSAELTFEVFEMPGLAPSDLKARIFSTSGIFNGVGGALYTSGPISVDLQAGYYYAIATAWGTPTINHFLDLNPQPAVSFGNKVLAFLFNAPLPGLFTGDLGSTTYNLYQELTVEGESWLSVDVPTGMVAPQGVQPIIVTADMTGFAPGTYEGDVSVLSNDPDEGLVVLPVGVLVGAQGQVYVDFEHIGVEVGSMLSPYNTLAEGLTAVQSGGTVSILGAGTSDEVLDVSQDVTIESVDGEATIGDSPPIAVSTPEGEGLASPATLSTAASGPNAIPLDVPSSPPAIPSEQVSVMNAVPAE